MLGAITGAVSGITSGILGYIGQKKQGEYNREAQAQENEANRNWSNQQRDQQNKFNLEQYHRTNQYNSPREQMARLAAAGLNPNLIYGSGGGQTQSVNPVKASTQASSHKEKIAPKQSGLSMLGTSAMTMAQIANLNANTESTKIDNKIKQDNYGAGGKDDSNLYYVKLWNEAQKSGEDSLGSYETNRLTRLKISGQELNNEMTQLQINLREEGINENDNVVMRAIVQALAKMDIDITDLTVDIIKKFLPNMQ